jgi:hypothetical protein
MHCLVENSTRGVAQPGSALGLGPRGRRFESSRPDHNSASQLHHLLKLILLADTPLIGVPQTKNHTQRG